MNTLLLPIEAGDHDEVDTPAEAFELLLERFTDIDFDIVNGVIYVTVKAPYGDRYFVILSE